MQDPDSVAADQLRTIVERVERVEEDIKALNDDKKEIYAEAKGNGFDVAILKKVIAIRRKPAAEVAEEDAMLDLYLNALSGPSRARAHDAREAAE